MPSTMSPGVIVKHFSRLIGAAFGTMIVISLRSLSESQWSYGDFRPGETAICTAADRR